MSSLLRYAAPRRAALALLAGALSAASSASAQPQAGEPQPADEGEPAGASRPGEASRSERAPRVTLPVVERSVEAVYPPDELAAGRASEVELFVVVREDGSVGAIEVARSGGEAFDDAAILAARRWRFRPAERDGDPVEARIRVPFRFDLPALAPAPGALAPSEEPTETRAEASSAGAGTEEGTEIEGEAPIEVTVRGERADRAERRGAGDVEIERDVIAAAPRSEGAEVLRTVPGVYIGRAAGPAVAHSYMLRGFDAEHGQDIEFRAGGIPINIPSHIHGQGYADLGFLIAETVGALRVSEGVYDPRQGDFAVAGSIAVDLAVAERGTRLEAGYGAFETTRGLAIWAPPDEPDESFGAFEYQKTDGFGENRAGQHASAIVQRRFGDGPTRWRAIGIARSARADTAGVVRRDDIESGRLCALCVYPYPTARAQGALAQRIMLGLFADRGGEQGSAGQIGAWMSYDVFRIRRNFTGFTEASRTLARVAGRGDLIEQQSSTLSVGLTARHRARPSRPAHWARLQLEIGADLRLDAADQAQTLVNASENSQIWDERVDAGIRGADLGAWVDLEARIGRRWTARVGARADALSYAVEDRLANRPPNTRDRDRTIIGARRTAAGLALGPRASLKVRVLDGLTALAALGQGYRSPQARTLGEGEPAPFTVVRSADLGARAEIGRALEVSGGVYETRLSDDVAFDAAEGRLERIGRTRRRGALARAVWRPAAWAVAAASFTWVDADLLEPPPPTAEEPQPPFEAGQALPFVPTLVARLDLGARAEILASLAGRALTARGGLGLSALGERPLPYNEAAEPFALLDLSAGLGWGPAELGLSILNALDERYGALEYSFPSDWDPDDGVRSRTPARHTAFGAPRAWMANLAVVL